MIIRNIKDKNINPGMIGLFFEDINYAADGGLYAELIENRSFSFVKAMGDAKDYYTVPDYSYGWSASSPDSFRIVSGSPLSENNSSYARINVSKEVVLKNKAYEGISFKRNKEYSFNCFARKVSYKNDFYAGAFIDGQFVKLASVSEEDVTEETYNFWKHYSISFTSDIDIENAEFALAFEGEGVIELAFVSLIPKDAVCGIFRADLYDVLNDLHPGFVRFPGGCIVEGNTYSNRYRFKDTLKPCWDRKTNWNRWAVHGNCKENDFTSEYSHYNQTYGLGFYEFFLLCESINAKALPVVNVGFACQYQSLEMLPIDSDGFEEAVTDALDLIEFANGDVNSKWGSIRAKMGHKESFNLEFLGIGNEQWQTEKADFFERYAIFERRIHEVYPDIKLIGSAGPDITSERYTMAWDFYRKNKNIKGFAYALDEHYYVKPEWLFEHNDFYDNYDREIKVFSGEYAAHPLSGFNRFGANTLWGALAEASFMTGLERNADEVVLASYAPLFARVGYAQWAPDMIWFDKDISYGTPSYYVQKLFANNMGDYTLKTDEVEKYRNEKLYYSLSFDSKKDEFILKIVNANSENKSIDLDSVNGKNTVTMFSLTGPDKDSYNSIDNPDNVMVKMSTIEDIKNIILPAYSFSVLRF